MSTDIPVPDMGEGIEEVTIVEWLRQVGDSVTEGDPIVTVETDKASMEIEAPATGTLTELLVEPGDAPEVGDPIARISES